MKGGARMRRDIDGDPDLEDDEEVGGTTVELIDPSGQVLRFRFVAALEHAETVYVVLSDLEPEAGEEDELMLMRVEPDPDGGMDRYAVIEDAEEERKVFERYVTFVANTVSEAGGERFRVLAYHGDEEEDACDCGMDDCDGSCSKGPQVLH
jgi:uncharacterized protein YrzB (UPF0473 family)